MTSPKKEIYLGREGKIYGPFEASELESFYTSGEIKTFTFIWTPASQQWRPIETPPPDPIQHEREQRQSSRALEAVCHDAHFFMLAGSLENVTDTGCDLVTEDRSVFPRLGLKSLVILNVLNPVSRKSTNMKVRLANVRRYSGRWIYRVQWNAPPPL